MKRNVILLAIHHDNDLFSFQLKGYKKFQLLTSHKFVLYDKNGLYLITVLLSQQAFWFMLTYKLIGI